MTASPLSTPTRRLAPARLFLAVVAARPGLLGGLLLCAAGVAAAELAIPWLLQQAVDAALGEGGAARLDRIGLAMLGVIAALYAFHCVLLRLEALVLYEGSFRLRRRLYAHLLTRPLAFFHRARTGELLHRVVSDTAVFEDNAVNLFSDLPFEVLTVVGVLTLMVVTDPRLAAVVVGFLLAASIVSAWVGRPLPTLRKSIQSVGAAFTARLQEGLSGIRTVKAFGREGHEVERLDGANRRLRELEVRGGRVEALLVPVFELMEMLGVVLIVWYGAHLILAGRITPGGLVAFIAYMELLAGPVSRAGKFYRHFQQCRAVSERLAGFLAEETGGDAWSGGGASQVPVPPWPIAFERVAFAYPGGARPALAGVSLAIRPGEVVAVVGRNGAGKSTLLDLLLGFHAPAEGHIRVGGVDLRDWNPAAWRAAVGVMPQEVFLFHATVAENIAYGRPEATPEEIEASARAAGLEGLMARLPQGLETVVGDRGARLSGGERQRIALARLFLKRPSILVLDEPTAHLDGEALAVVGDAVASLGRDRTTLLVAHRPETIRRAHRVVLLDEGKVIAEGSHEELLATQPLYASLVASRAREGRRPRGEGVAREDVSAVPSA